MADNPNKPEPFRVLFVCTGNTCRSPMAEGILKKALADRDGGLPPIEVRSAGTGGIAGAPATRPAQEISARQGVDISKHKARPASSGLLEDSDLILGLAAEHVDQLLRQGVPSEKVFILRGFPERPEDWRELSIFDPIGQRDEIYEEVYFQIDEAIHHALPEIIARAKAKAKGKG